METEGRPRRKAITKLQRRTAVAMELIALCQGITEDGHLTDDEVNALADWLKANRNADLPAIAHMAEVIERALADHKITDEERTEIYKAIEAVLPPDVRMSVSHARREVVRADKEQAKERKTRNAPIESWKFTVAGVMFEGRGAIVEEHGCENNDAYLLRDRANRYSRNAVEVRLLNGMQIGYVPERLAVEVAPLLDAGHRHSARILKIYEGSQAPIPFVGANVYGPEADPLLGVLEADVPRIASPPAASLQSVLRAAGGDPSTFGADVASPRSRIGWVIAGIALFVAWLAWVVR